MEEKIRSTSGSLLYSFLECGRPDGTEHVRYQKVDAFWTYGHSFCRSRDPSCEPVAMRVRSEQTLRQYEC